MVLIFAVRLLRDPAKRIMKLLAVPLSLQVKPEAAQTGEDNLNN